MCVMGCASSCSTHALLPVSYQVFFGFEMQRPDGCVQRIEQLRVERLFISFALRKPEKFKWCHLTVASR